MSYATMTRKERSEKNARRRKRVHLTQDQLADRAGVSQTTVSYWEHGIRLKPLNEIKIDKALSSYRWAASRHA